MILGGCYRFTGVGSVPRKEANNPTKDGFLYGLATVRLWGHHRGFNVGHTTGWLGFAAKDLFHPSHLCLFLCLGLSPTSLRRSDPVC